MPIQQSKKQSDLEKRLQLLRRQVYGRDIQSQRVKESKSQNTLTLRDSFNKIKHNSLSHSTASSNDLSYLHQDLLKILTFSSFAIGAQIVLFFLLKNHILKINFF